MLDEEVREILSPGKRGKTLIITVGNSLRKDDGVGPYIAECLAGRLPPEIILLNAGDRPENAIEIATMYRPIKTVIIDAALFGAIPGKVKVIPKEEIPTVVLSTHIFPIPILSKLITEDTGSEVFFVGVQPQDVNFGEGISQQVKEAADEIVKYLLQVVQYA
jgi:hydrogenase 3 maturation protease